MNPPEPFIVVHLCGGPLDGDVRRLQVIPGQPAPVSFHFRAHASSSVFHHYRRRPAKDSRARTFVADYVPLRPALD
jgi:hypothetical protein